MFQAILCDDNEIILEGLAHQIDWEGIGIHLAGTAADGKSAWELIQTAPPDILITDIRMPYIDGLELSKRALTLNPDLVILIISAYDDFEYARTAMHLKALDYILKPIDLDTLNLLLEKAVAHCRQFHRDKRVMTTDLLRSFAMQEVHPNLSPEAFTELSLNTDSFCCILHIQISDESLNRLSEDVRYDEERKFAALRELVCQNNCYLLQSHHNSYTLCLVSNSKLELGIHRKIIVDSVRKYFPYENDYCDVVITSGNTYLGINNLHKSMTDCSEALKYHFIKGSNAEIFYEELESYIRREPADLLPYSMTEANLITFIKEQNKDGITRELNHLKKWLYSQGSESFLYLTFSIGSFYANLVKDLGDSGIDLQDIFENPIEEFKKITAERTLESSIENLRLNLFRICDSIRMHKSRYGKLIDQAIMYIQNHYSDSSFSIDEVAGAVCLSSSYFSTIFKNETGTTFTDYLIKIRMEKAKALLENTNMKMYEISSLVGYDNAAYFSAAFKRYFGKSPSEFQNR